MGKKEMDENCKLWRDKYEEEILREDPYKIFGEISEAKFKYFKCKYFEMFKDSDLDTLYYQLDHQNFNSIIRSHSVYTFMYIYFVYVNDLRNLVFKFTDRGNLQNDFSTESDEMLYIIEKGNLVIYKGDLERDSEAYSTTFSDVYQNRVGSGKKITRYIENYMVERVIFPHMITFHLILNENNQISLATQVNTQVLGQLKSSFLNRGKQWP